MQGCYEEGLRQADGKRIEPSLLTSTEKYTLWSKTKFMNRSRIKYLRNSKIFLYTYISDQEFRSFINMYKKSYGALKILYASIPTIHTLLCNIILADNFLS